MPLVKNRYKRTRMLGEGAEGTVFLVEDKNFKQEETEKPKQKKYVFSGIFITIFSYFFELKKSNDSKFN